MMTETQVSPDNDRAMSGLVIGEAMGFPNVYPLMLDKNDENNLKILIPANVYVDLRNKHILLSYGFYKHVPFKHKEATLPPIASKVVWSSGKPPENGSIEKEFAMNMCVPRRLMRTTQPHPISPLHQSFKREINLPLWLYKTHLVDGTTKEILGYELNYSEDAVATCIESQNDPNTILVRIDGQDIIYRLSDLREVDMETGIRYVEHSNKYGINVLLKYNERGHLEQFVKNSNGNVMTYDLGEWLTSNYFKHKTKGQGGAFTNKLLILGRLRKVTKEGRTSYITYQGTRMSLTQARKEEARLKKEKAAHQKTRASPSRKPTASKASKKK